MFLTADINISQEFVLECQYEKILPIDNLLKSIEDSVTEVVSQSLSELVIKIEAENEAGLKKFLENAWADLYPKKAEAMTLEITRCFDDADSVMANIRNMVGWDSYKNLCEEIALVAPQLKKSGAEKCFLFQNFLFSVNSGYGLTTALENFSKLTSSLGLFDFSEEEPVVEVKLAEEDSGNELKISSVLEKLYDENFSMRLICFDISNYLEKSKHLELKNFLRKLQAVQEYYIFAFSVPFLEPETLSDIRAVLADVLEIRVISVVPFNDEQFKRCAEMALHEFGYCLDEGASKVFFARLSEEKSDGKFYGIQTVKNIVYEMVWLKAKALASATRPDKNSEIIISASDISDLSVSHKDGEKDGFEELNSLIGMEKITAQIKEIVAQVKVALNNPKLDRPCLHMRFTGAPGTGKTTVARIVGKIFRESGILRNGYFFEYSARSLCGEYVGQTAPKTAGICRDAYGSVLFIDEAYALYEKDGQGTDYGKEAITTLISEMETHRNDMVIIMAGYKEDMDTLMEANSGLRSRMPFKIEFESYTRDQLFEIFMMMVKKAFSYNEEFEAEVKKYFTTLSEDYLGSREFANARFVRNLFERTWSKAALRTALSDISDITLTKEDFIAASSEKEFSEKLMMKRKLGF